MAVTGKAFDFIMHEPKQVMNLKRVLLNASIYARMSPDDKAKLVMAL